MIGLKPLDEIVYRWLCRCSLWWRCRSDVATTVTIALARGSERDIGVVGALRYANVAAEAACRPSRGIPFLPSRRRKCARRSDPGGGLPAAAENRGRPALSCRPAASRPDEWLLRLEVLPGARQLAGCKFDAEASLNHCIRSNYSTRANSARAAI